LTEREQMPGDRLKLQYSGSRRTKWREMNWCQFGSVTRLDAHLWTKSSHAHLVSLANASATSACSSPPMHCGAASIHGRTHIRAAGEM